MVIIPIAMGNAETKQHPPKPPPPSVQLHHEVRQLQPETKQKSLRESIDGFIRDLNCGSSPAISISELDSSGITSFTYLGLEFRLEVPEGAMNDSAIMVQTWFEHSKKAAGISGRVMQYNAAFREMGLDGKLTFRNVSGKFAFTLTQKMDPEKFSKTLVRHGIEYFVEMSIKLHNIINSTDTKKVGKVRLVESDGLAESDNALNNKSDKKSAAFNISCRF